MHIGMSHGHPATRSADGEGQLTQCLHRLLLASGRLPGDLLRAHLLCPQLLCPGPAPDPHLCSSELRVQPLLPTSLQQLLSLPAGLLCTCLLQARLLHPCLLQARLLQACLLHTCLLQARVLHHPSPVVLLKLCSWASPVGTTWAQMKDTPTTSLWQKQPFQSQGSPGPRSAGRGTQGIRGNWLAQHPDTHPLGGCPGLTHRHWEAPASSMCQLLGSRKQTNCSLWSTPSPLPARLGWWRADGKG
ncbi:hypothetical protein E5288_WYG010845 [Bos mutus]|uniref:Uncharacterized protein n=1 Tax=Bos mutus TaxID=72004 RepID=A0A6B0QYT7_9CETA|nr:hypothetical protein [Bos mutus]